MAGVGGLPVDGFAAGAGSRLLVIVGGRSIGRCRGCDDRVPIDRTALLVTFGTVYRR
jgi:hypothetical protein